jgi:hypothetical protein
MPNVYVEARPKGRPEGSAIEEYVVEDHADQVLAPSKHSRRQFWPARTISSTRLPSIPSGFPVSPSILLTSSSLTFPPGTYEPRTSCSPVLVPGLTPSAFNPAPTLYVRSRQKILLGVGGYGKVVT